MKKKKKQQRGRPPYLLLGALILSVLSNFWLFWRGQWLWRSPLVCPAKGVAAGCRPCPVLHEVDRTTTATVQPRAQHGGVPPPSCFHWASEWGNSSNVPGPNNRLAQIFFDWPADGRSLHKWLNYLDVYNRHFKHLLDRNGPLHVLEIGSGDGGGLQLLARYFGPRARIYGADLKNQSVEYGQHMFIGDQGNPQFLRRLRDELPVLDAIIDDGSHISSHMIATFRVLFDKLRPKSGVYLVEDVATSYWSKGGFGGALEPPDSAPTFISLAKRLLDVVHSHHVRPPQWQEYVRSHLVPFSYVLTNATRDPRDDEREALWWSELSFKLDAVHVYDQVVVIEARHHPKTYAYRVPENVKTSIDDFFW